MTNKEAIEILRYNSNVIHKTINKETDPNEVEALNMAIQALEQTQAVKDAIAEIEQIVKEEKPEDNSWACGLKYSIGIIRKHTGVEE